MRAQQASGGDRRAGSWSAARPTMTFSRKTLARCLARCAADIATYWARGGAAPVPHAQLELLALVRSGRQCRMARLAMGMQRLEMPARAPYRLQSPARAEVGQCS